MGSVKDLKISKLAYENDQGQGDFDFSDRYSVFDWGEMPDHIKIKGAALAVMAAFNFEELEKRGIRTHYRGLVTDNGTLIGFSNLPEKGNGAHIMRVALGVRYDPIARKIMGADCKPATKYDYSFFEVNRKSIKNYLIGLEVIFRNGLPQGSSVFDKIAEIEKIGDPVERQMKLHSLIGKYGLKAKPQPGDMLPRPVINYTTKFEAGDRSLTEEEAYHISGLADRNFRRIEPLTLQIDEIITELAERAGMHHWDGKIEMVYNDGLVVADVLGTFDENRFSFNEKQVSKEFLRQWYIKNQPEFRPACKEWEKTGPGWQQRCPIKPIPLPGELSTLVSQMYMAGCNQYVGRRIFNAPKLRGIMDKLAPYME